MRVWPAILLLYGLCIAGVIREVNAAENPAQRRLWLDPQIEALSDPVTVLVGVHDGSWSAAHGFDIVEAVAQMIGPEKVRGSMMPFAFVATVDKADIERLASHPHVAEIREINSLRLAPALTDAVEIVHAIDAWSIQAGGVGLTGEGQSIAIMDFGIDWSHPDLASKNIVGCNIDCYSPPVFDPCVEDCSATDCDGHGTHVAGITGASGGISGIGMGVNLISLKIFGPNCEAGDILGMMRAINWAVQNRDLYNISAISISLGGSSICEFMTAPCDDDWFTLFQVVQIAVDAGIAVVAAAGNDECTNGFDIPACLSNVIPVGATNKDDTFAFYSNLSTELLLFAPGTSILSTCASEDMNCDSGIYDHKTGTSMSTPMVSAAIAIIRQFLDTIGESMTPAEMEQLMFDTSDPIVDLPFTDWRRINIESAILSLIDQFITPGDLDLDGSVGITDFLDLLAAWGPCPDPCPPSCAGDLDDDCAVGITDFLMLLANWS